MSVRVFKVHTDLLGRLIDCIRHAMYGVSKGAFTQRMPHELKNISPGDIVFISEREVHRNVLFGPFHVTEPNRDGVVIRNRVGMWADIDRVRTPQENLATWAIVEGYTWCLFFDRTLVDQISIVWPNQWQLLNVELPAWGHVSGEDAEKLIEFAANNQVEAREFMMRHGIW